MADFALPLQPLPAFAEAIAEHAGEKLFTRWAVVYRKDHKRGRAVFKANLA